jgi:V/A-type H+-transporting ATPase subunit E
MGKQDIVDRILSDASEEAEGIISEAEEVAARILSDARDGAEREMQNLRVETEAKVNAILAGKQATARLDGAKILLAEKRAVIDDVYARAAKELLSLSASDCLAMTERLLKSYAEEGDEVIFAHNFPCVKEASELSVVKQKHLKITFGGKMGGGFILCGKTADKDLSFAALLAADRAEHEAEIGAEIFK